MKSCFVRSTLFLLFFISVSCVHADAPKSKKEAALAAKAEAEKIQAAWDDAKTFKSTFHQVVYSKGLGTREESDGVIYVAKPDRLRWEAKDGSLQILGKDKRNKDKRKRDREVLWVVQPNRRREGRIVDKWIKVSAAVNAQLLSFIAGKKKLEDIYEIKPAPAGKAGKDTLTFKFSPKTSDGESLIAKVDKKSYLLRSLTSESLDSRIILELGKIETNVPMDDTLFEFEPEKNDTVHEN